MLVEFDIAARTFEGTVFDTRELKQQADAEASHLEQLLGDISSASEERCLALRAQLKAEECLPPVKEVFEKKNSARLSELYAAQDEKQFESIILEAKLDDPADIEQRILFICDNGKSELSERYVAALNTLSGEQLSRAKRHYFYQKAGMPIIIICSLFAVAFSIWALIRVGAFAAVLGFLSSFYIVLYILKDVDACLRECLATLQNTKKVIYLSKNSKKERENHAQIPQ